MVTFFVLLTSLGLTLIGLGAASSVGMITGAMAIFGAQIALVMTGVSLMIYAFWD